MSTKTLINRRSLSWAAIVPLVLVTVTAGILIKQHSHASTAVPGQGYLICDNPGTFLTSPYTYHALASGSQSYSVAQYEALPGYGTTLPPLPTYISSQSSGTEAAEIFAPGSNAGLPQYDFPESPILYFFEGGSYGGINLQTVSGDEFIGGSAPGFPEPTFNDGGGAAGISSANDSFSYQNNSGTPVIAHLATAAAQGATSITLSASTIPLLPWGSYHIGSSNYTVSAVAGSQSGYTLTIPNGLDAAVASNAPVYYANASGDVTVSYLDISNDQHTTTGTIYTGSGWTITHNNIHDGYSNGPGNGVAVYGGDQGTVEYNCFSKMGDYAINVFGSNNKFDYNEVFQTNYEPDPGCGCSGGGKWWGSLNADIVGNAFIDDSAGGSFPVWLDNGNSGTLIQGNFFDKDSASAISSETGFNLDITGNLFQDVNWGTGTGPGNPNQIGAINLNSSGGFNVPGSRYENEVLITGNQFINSWGGVGVWQSGGRSCLNSGEEPAGYCPGGFPNSANNSAGGQYDFSHWADSSNGWGNNLAQSATSGSSVVMVAGSVANDDQIGFTDPAKTTASSTMNVSTLTGSGTVNVASTAGFPTSGQLRVGTSAAWGNNTGGDYSATGAILSYTGISGNSFTGVALVRGSGTLDTTSGHVWQVQPYKVTSETCYANDCAVSIAPALSSPVSAGTNVTNAGTCQLFATAGATPTSPMAPDGESYFDGCTWGTAGINVNNNSFSIDPAAMNASTALNGGAVSCTPANDCGMNFMAYQEAGDAPYNTFIGGNAMMSNSNLTTCPSWDSNCTTSPLKNINALSNPPNAPAANGEPSDNNVWSNNTYAGPWQWDVYWYGTCGQLPSDPATGKGMPASPNACSGVDFAHWQSDWQQDAGSTYSATVTPTPSTSSTPTPSATATPTPSPTSSPSGKIGDLNNDGQVNIFDLSILLTAWGTNNATADLNHDGTVNVFDLSILLSHWGT